MSAWLGYSYANMRVGLIVQVPTGELSPQFPFQRQQQNHPDTQDTSYCQTSLHRRLLSNATQVVMLSLLNFDVAFKNVNPHPRTCLLILERGGGRES